MAIKYKLQKGGTVLGGHSQNDLFIALAQQNARRVSAGVTAVTNNSGGTAGTGILARETTLTDTANSGTNLAQKAATEAALNTVLDALGELATKANATATALGLTGFTNNAGGTTPDGTIGAITVSTTAATTGVVAAATGTTLTALDNLQYQVYVLINKLCVATGVTPLSSNYSVALQSTVAAITISGGTAADPGLTKVAVDAILARYQANIKTLGTALIAVNTSETPLIVAV